MHTPANGLVTLEVATKLFSSKGVLRNTFLRVVQ